MTVLTNWQIPALSWFPVHTSFARRILHVVHGCSEKKVIWIDAAANVALVEYQQTNWYVSAMQPP